MVSSGTYGQITKYRDEGRSHPFVVYMALNKLNGAFYIGATEKGTNQRAAIHISHVRHGGKDLRFYRAIKKYGEDNFKFLTIKECDDYWDALESEKQYISLLKPRYNMTNGGGGIKGYKHTPQSIAKMSAAKKGRPGLWSRQVMPDHIRKRIGDCRRAEKGRKLTGSHRDAIRLNAKLANEGRRKPVIELSTGRSYNSVKNAAAAHGLTAVWVSHLCKSHHTSEGGLSFRYVENHGQ